MFAAGKLVPSGTTLPQELYITVVLTKLLHDAGQPHTNHKQSLYTLCSSGAASPYVRCACDIIPDAPNLGSQGSSPRNTIELLKLYFSNCYQKLE